MLRKYNENKRNTKIENKDKSADKIILTLFLDSTLVKQLVYALFYQCRSNISVFPSFIYLNEVEILRYYIYIYIRK